MQASPPQGGMIPSLEDVLGYAALAASV